MDKFEELLAKYGKTADEVTFEYANLSDEELEVAFKEAFEETEENTDPVEEPVEEPAEEVQTEEASSDDDDVEPQVEEHVADVVEEPATEEQTEEVVEQPEEKFVLKYELSHDDIRSALYSLLSATSDDGYCYVWILEVYDDKFIYCDAMESKYYRQNYTRDGDTVALGEDKVEVFNEWLSKAEKDALDALKADYAALKEFKETYDAAVIKAQKEEVLYKDEYACLAEDDAFAQLKADIDKYSVEEISTKADLIFASHMKSTMEFSAKPDGKKKADFMSYHFAREEEPESPYGNLFKKK